MEGSEILRDVTSPNVTNQLRGLESTQEVNEEQRSDQEKSKQVFPITNF